MVASNILGKVNSHVQQVEGDFNSDAALRGAVSLPKIVARYAGGACKDPRDQIYSLVGLASRDSGYPIHYDATVASVIWELAIRSPGKQYCYS